MFEIDLVLGWAGFSVGVSTLLHDVQHFDIFPCDDDKENFFQLCGCFSVS